jgi:hypothetical protein
VQRAAGVDQRGDQGMGFSHTMTGHHFHLCSDGGVIEVESNSPDDDASKEAIRRHMQKIAGMFAQGDFSLPMFIHDTVPPGVEAIKHLKDQITYTAEKTAKGAPEQYCRTRSSEGKKPRGSNVRLFNARRVVAGVELVQKIVKCQFDAPQRPFQRVIPSVRLQLFNHLSFDQVDRLRMEMNMKKLAESNLER